jgi:L-ribulokinase
VLNQVYANVMGKPILVPKGDVTSLGSAIFAFLAAGTFRSVAEAQDALCPGHAEVQPQPEEAATYRDLYAMYRKLYFAFGEKRAAAVELGSVLPELRTIAARVRGGQSAGSAAN